MNTWKRGPCDILFDVGCGPCHCHFDECHRGWHEHGCESQQCALESSGETFIANGSRFSTFCQSSRQKYVSRDFCSAKFLEAENICSPPVLVLFIPL